ncbi:MULTISPECIES: LLM class F420-dependent oxidoreductase [Acidithrix]|uniref:Pyrimidine monooxygenase RutA n=2 Tax=root TaxID=1 RepID=A0A0D8HDA7_9ACTN|nr:MULTISPECIES: LLM class F420-dependent oxidoreductase [Acidithrix]KJF15903.1 pyrimidine monooxygenase RutA [Acidithrix ferrooxidans]CAG4916623.1 unnamed protein product [Acidithrix sp. C25]
MQYGALIFPTQYSIPIELLAIEMEDRGLISLMFPEHTHIPASRTTPYPGGGELPKEYAHTFDPFVALSIVAAKTKTLKIGTGISLVVERDPIVLAKEVASLDYLSGGRFEFGVGAGWNREEMSNHGTEPTSRFKLLKERIEAMKEIWTNDNATYHGDFVNFDNIWSWPKPLTSPHPPILVGGDGESAFARTLDYGDIWMPIARNTTEEFGLRVQAFKEYAQQVGRDIPPIYLYGAPISAKKIIEYQKHSVSRVLFWLPSADYDTIMSYLDRITALIATLNEEMG